MALEVHIVCIDQQNDFCDRNGSLYVKGGEENVGRTAKMIKRLNRKISDVHASMDSHRKLDISHPMWWVNSKGQHPAPYTVITPDDVKNGTWRPYVISHRDRSLQYLETLRATNRYAHVIWPEHCLIGDAGHNIHPILSEAIHEWEETNHAMTDIVTKGSNPWTEHFSAVQAEVPDPEDPGTQINRPLIQTLEKADIIIWVGEALSHCLANTFRDVARNFSDPKYIRKMILCTDASSPVPGFENLAQDFIREMTAKGMQLSTTTDVLS